MSYAYIFMHLAEPAAKGEEPIGEQHIGPLPPADVVQARLSALFPDMTWSRHGDSLFGAVPPQHRAEFTLQAQRAKPADHAFTYNGPADWIPTICTALGLHCLDPQVMDLWDPAGERRSLRRAV